MMRSEKLRRALSAPFNGPHQVQVVRSAILTSMSDPQHARALCDLLVPVGSALSDAAKHNLLLISDLLDSNASDEALRLTAIIACANTGS
jgi:hypothetical protein